MAPLAFVNAGLMWAGMGLVSVPILIHIFFRRQHRVVRWAAMAFLLRAIKKQRRRLQLENLLLLLLRCALLALLGLALARPAVRGSAVANLTGSSRNVVLVIDTSASMAARHTGRRALDRARERAGLLLEDLPESSRVTLVVTRDDLAGGAPRAPIQNAPPSEVRARLASVSVSHGPNHLAEVFRLVRDKIADLRGRRAVVFLTDLQRRDWAGEDQPRREDVFRALLSLRPEGEEEPVPVSLQDVGTEEIANVAITEFTKESGRELFAGTLSALVVTLANYGPQPVFGTVTLSMAREGSERWEKKTAVEVELKASDATVTSLVTKKLHLPLPPGHEGAARFKVKFESRNGGNDRLDEDSLRRLALRIRPPVRFLPVRTYGRALTIFQNTEYDGGALTIGAPILPELLSTYDLGGTDVVLWADADPLGLDERGARNLEEFVRHGGGLLIYLGTDANPRRINELFFKERGEGLLPMRLKEADPVQFDEESLVEIDIPDKPMQHPLFREMTQDATARALFFSPAIESFHAVEEYEDEAVVARFTSPAHDPAVLEHQLGSGRVIVVMTSPDERTLRLNGSFMPMILFFEAAHFLVAEDVADRNVIVDQPIRIHLPPEIREAIIEPPEGAGGRVTEPVEKDRRTLMLSDTAVPGFYRVTLRGPASASTRGLVTQEVHVAAVNLEASEGDLRRISPTRLASLYRHKDIRLHFAEEGENALAETGAAGGGELSRMLLSGVGILLFIELLLAWRFGSRRRGAGA